MLIALNRLWKFNLSQKELVIIAKSIDSKLADILKIFFNPPKMTKNVVLVRPKHIIIDKDWIKTRKAFQYFPDLKEIVSILKKKSAQKSGMSGTGSMLFGLFDEMVNKKDLKRILTKKTDFIWMGKTCNIKL